MKIVVLDGYTLNPGDISWDPLKKLGELIIYDRTPDELAAERIADAWAIFINKVHMTKEVMDKCPNLKFIGTMSTGYNVVDIEAAKQRGIVVANVPAYATTAVAQYTIAMLLTICHRIAEHSQSVRNGDWTANPDWCYWNYPIIELNGKTIGIIGFGKIGQEVARLAQAFGMKVLAFDEFKDSSLESNTCRYVSLDELLALSDVISLHCPLFPSTEGIINKKTLAVMKDGVIIINASRGPLINEEDLHDALLSGKVYCAGVDVVSTESIEMDNALLEAENIYITPHQAWAPLECRSRMMDILAGNLEAFINGKPENVVNL